MPKLTFKMNKAMVYDDLFEQVGIIKNDQTYTEFYNKALDKTTSLLPRNKLKKREVNRVINDIEISTKGISDEVYNFVVLSAATSIIYETQLNAADKKLFRPIFIMLNRYKNPVTFVKKANKFNSAIISNNFSSITASEKVIFNQFKGYINNNREFIKKTITDSRKHMERINKLIKRNVSKSIFGEMKEQIKTKVIDNEVERFKTDKEVIKGTKAKFKPQFDSDARRILRTELHDLTEQTKLAQHVLLGFTHKQWLNEGINIRDTHRKLYRETVKIKAKFNVGGTMALHPSASNLPPEERINCKCPLRYLRL